MSSGLLILRRESRARKLEAKGPRTLLVASLMNTGSGTRPSWPPVRDSDTSG